MSSAHTYTVVTEWTGNSGSGTSRYGSYSRDHDVLADGKPVIEASADPAFRGDVARWNPEELLVASLSQCHMLTYLALCSLEGVVVTSYRDRAEGVMEAEPRGGGRFVEVHLHPVVTVADAAMVDVASSLHERAREECYVAASVNFPVSHHPVIEVDAPGDRPGAPTPRHLPFPAVNASPLTPEHRRAWREDGWCVLERAVPATELARAQQATAKLFPTAAEMAAPAADDDRERWRIWDAPWPEFPFRSRSLCQLAVGPLMVGIARDLLGTQDVRMYLALVTAKYAGQPSDYNRLLHADYPNHTLTVPRPEDGYQQMETFVYLSDVDSANGATHFLSRSLSGDIPVEEHTLNLDDRGHLYDRDVEVAAPAGSIVVYRPDVYHRSMDFTDKTRARFMLHVSYRPAMLEWGGYQAWPIKGFSAEWHNFVAHATPDQLAVVGFPPPGHPYWTAETLAGVGRRYPELDLSPWSGADRSGR